MSRPQRKPVAVSLGPEGAARTTTLVREADPDGRPVEHHRTVDTLGRMLNAGSITPEMHDAARDFHAAFTIAALDTLRVPPLVRVPGQSRSPEPSDTQLGARRRVDDALQALGGAGSPAGSCAWHVVGLQCSIREWALRQGWGGRPVHQQQAQGILVAALGVLARHYGYGPGKPKRRVRSVV